MDRENLSKENLIEWMEYPVTKAFLAGVNERIKELHLELGSGRTIKESAHETSVETAKIVAKIDELQNILDIDIIKE